MHMDIWIPGSTPQEYKRLMVQMTYNQDAKILYPIIAPNPEDL